MDLTLGAIQTWQLNQLSQRLDVLDTKLGPQLPNGGVSGALTRAAQLAKKTWDFLQVDRVLNVLTWIGVLHNAYMLSNNLAQTLFSAISISLDVFGIEQDDGSPLDVGQMVSRWTDGFFKSIFGVDTVEGIKAQWKRFNRIYQAASNLLFSIQSMMYSMHDALEVVGNYVAKIGNAARIWGVFTEKAYGWMNPNLNFTDNRFFRALNNATEAVENIEQVAASVKDIQELGEELAGNKQRLEEALTAEEQQVGQAANQNKQSSRGPSIPQSAESRPEGD